MAMSYASIINNLPNKLAQPNNISILASLGLHALLFLALPNLSISPGGETQRRTVQVTELSPVEQMRLPNFSPPPVAPFSFPEPSVINPPLGTPSLDLPNSTALVPPSSTPPTDTQPPITSTFPQIPVVPLPPPPQFTLKPLPPIAPAPQDKPTPPPPQSDTVAKLPPSNTLPTLPTKPNTVPTLPPNPNRTLRFPPPPPPIGARDLINQRTQNDTVAKLPPPTNTLPTLPTKPNTVPTLPPNPNQTLRFPPPPPPIGARDSTNQRTAANSVESPLPPAPPLPSDHAPTLAPPTDTIERQREQQLVAELRQRRASLSEDQTATTNEEARKNYTYWWSAVKAETKPEELSLAGTYPLDACVKKLEGTTVYGVVVNAQGSVVNTELIKGAGYPIFNNQALEQIKGRSFLNPTGNPKPYLVNVNYKYSSEVCPSLSIAPPKPASESVAEEPAPTPPTPAPAPEPTEPPQPKPDSSPAPEPTEPQSTDTAKPTPTRQEAPAAPPTPAPAPEKPQVKPAPPAQRQEAPVAPAPPNAPPTTNQSPSETLGGPINSPNPLMQPKPARNTPEASDGEADTTENKE